MLQALVAAAIILAMLLGWLGVQRFARSFAARHPEFGPPREGGGCADRGACEACGLGKSDCPAPNPHSDNA